MNATKTIARRFVQAGFIVSTANKDKVSTMFAKANKDGLFSMSFGETITKRRPSINGMIEMNYIEVFIEGMIPGIPGFNLVGKIEDDETGARIIHNFDSENVNLSAFRKVALNCDHCNKNIRRTESWILNQESDDSYMQVGSACIDKFFGLQKNIVDIIQRVFGIVEQFNVNPDKDESFGSGTPCYDVKTVLAKAIAAVRFDNGYKGAKYDYLTRNTVNALMQRNGSYIAKDMGYVDVGDLISKNIGYVDTLIDNVMAQKAEGNMADWILNIQSLVQAEYVTSRRLGLLISAAFFFDTKPKMNSNLVSEYVGTVKGKIENVTLIVKGYSAWVYSQFGSYVWATLVVKGTGNIVKTKIKASQFTDVDGNEMTEIHIKSARIADHTEYNGVKQTQITHVKYA